MIVEFMGPPGSGKSTLAQAAADRLGVQSVNLTGYFDTGGSLLPKRVIRRERATALLTQPRLTVETLRCWRHEGRGLALSWMMNLQRRALEAHSMTCRSGVWLLEEGPVNALCLAMAARRSQWNWSAIAPRVCVADAVVHIHAPAPLAAARIAERAGILSDMPDDEKVDLLSRYEAAARSVRAVLPGLVLEIDALLPVEQNTERITEFVEQWR